MKKVLLGAIAFFALASCGTNHTKEEVMDDTIICDTVAVDTTAYCDSI